MKRFFAFVLAFLMVFSVFGCNKKSEDYPYMSEEDETWDREALGRFGLKGFLKPLDMTIETFICEKDNYFLIEITGEKQGENIPDGLYGATCEEIKRVIGENGVLGEEETEKGDGYELYKYDYKFLDENFRGYVKYEGEKGDLSSRLVIYGEKPVECSTCY